MAAGVRNRSVGTRLRILGRCGLAWWCASSPSLPPLLGPGLVVLVCAGWVPLALFMRSLIPPSSRITLCSQVQARIALKNRTTPSCIYTPSEHGPTTHDFVGNPQRTVSIIPCSSLRGPPTYSVLGPAPLSPPKSRPRLPTGSGSTRAHEAPPALRPGSHNPTTRPPRPSSATSSTRPPTRCSPSVYPPRPLYSRAPPHRSAPRNPHLRGQASPRYPAILPRPETSTYTPLPTWIDPSPQTRQSPSHRHPPHALPQKTARRCCSNFVGWGKPLESVSPPSPKLPFDRFSAPLLLTCMFCTKRDGF